MIRHVLGERPPGLGRSDAAPEIAALLDRDSAVSLTVAKGLTTWIMTFYAMIIPGMLPQARELWARLNQGYEGVEEAYKFMLRREPSDVERAYFDYRPAFLLS